jgi:mono/diheme cytochrome c family protein
MALRITKTHKQSAGSRILILTSALFLLMAWIPNNARAQNQKGKEIFEKYCTACHKISDEKLIGPGLKGITERRDSLWIRSFIKSSQTLVKSGDKTAVKVFNENSMIPMPDHTMLTDDDLTNLIDYIAKYDPNAVRLVTVDAKKRSGFWMDEVARGKDMFFGITKPKEGAALNCASCHNDRLSDTLNFNPSALDLANAWLQPNGTDLYKVLNEPSSAKMKEAHKDLKMSDKEIYDFSAYLSRIPEEGMKPLKKFPMRSVLFVLFAVLMTWALLDLFWFKKCKKRLVHLLILLAGLSVHSVFAVQEGINLSRTQNYAPDQPIKFSHKIHAGQNKIDCEYCHSSAAFGKSAGLPAASLCLNCHKVVTQGTRSGKAEINKISAAIANNTPIEWVRIHKLPDHVYFNHSQHVTAGKVDCDKCHGDMTKVDIANQFQDLSMGWCVNCHRDTEVQFANNPYYKAFHDFQKNMKSGSMKKVTVDKIGGLDCSKCHY